MEIDSENSDATAQRGINLSELLARKIQEKKSDLQSIISENEFTKTEEINPEVREMYKTVGKVLSRYRSGKIPKAFKIIPSMRNWEEILFLTEPEKWSAAAMFKGTRVFISALSKTMSQRFCSLVLLPRVRDDLKEYKKLNRHLYNALEYALFKPGAFMKGIVLPLLEDSDDNNMREAIIISSIISRNSVPVLHSAACLLKICEMNYSPVNSIFIRDFLNKRYSLPYRVLNAVHDHFMRFRREDGPMPVLWHQCLLAYVQRYKNDLSDEQKKSLSSLMSKHTHHQITPEIRRELYSQPSCNTKPNESMEC